MFWPPGAKTPRQTRRSHGKMCCLVRGEEGDGHGRWVWAWAVGVGDGRSLGSGRGIGPARTSTQCQQLILAPAQQPGTGLPLPEAGITDHPPLGPRGPHRPGSSLCPPVSNTAKGIGGQWSSSVVERAGLDRESLEAEAKEGCRPPISEDGVAVCISPLHSK